MTPSQFKYLLPLLGSAALFGVMAAGVLLLAPLPASYPSTTVIGILVGTVAAAFARLVPVKERDDHRGVVKHFLRFTQVLFIVIAGGFVATRIVPDIVYRLHDSRPISPTPFSGEGPQAACLMWISGLAFVGTFLSDSIQRFVAEVLRRARRPLDQA